MENYVIILAAYLLGSIPSALWIGKLFYGTDVRQHGSGNMGATNTFRVLGKKAGIVVTLLDIFKGTAAVLLPLLPYFHDTAIHPLILGVVAVLGHIFPIFANLRGGKAVATSGGVLLGYNWPIFLLVVITFLIALKLTKMVSLTSIIVSVMGPLYCLIYYFMGGDLYLFLVVALMGFFIFYRHRDNITRIKNGTEPKVKWL
ncbi:glycerol-3-phosphate 1-O-acyltransferase PlsY [Sporosarcina sp. P21c]|uniref:glycerol-3-phosphate 1-O-acyltransferase PlsY n=1 Tax=Sporosarcina TaxID=1569 RepID=UPI000A155531|nr:MULTISPECIES: glycerol-3-phosphate 1-O-acyltransferase PlsY [Sporosarcina]ARJ37557.1 glycerol-3-phosphate acyltransferase [Sporosarcina ureae]PIC67139.1 glycerol-3-phosphate 1-O-acyltransferase PlsY [Sporosarcina sp. P16a]PIC82740.1 glycerol-3-phosphate 1-O-acyltransferase PlsY [Sporosarcina sp. P1]PIC89567.1 glycerol-3-phosphate 1-O-acyltransferase PlsY [Sporosarcina sp. P21c]PIC92591.1 glycerol-3-phosphate 1-O-acyltransferase PlsY [Sporosarcina sp. P25]